MAARSPRAGGLPGIWWLLMGLGGLGLALIIASWPV
jgi:hypothetical protein